MTRTRCGLLVGLAVATTTPRARADDRAGPDVDVARCTSLDRAAVARTVGAELANLGPEVRRALAQHVLLVDCPDAVTANLRVEPAVAGVQVTRSIDLTDLPAEFRVRLVALAGAELLETVAAALPPASPPALGVVPAPPDAARPPGDPDDPMSMRDRAAPPVVALEPPPRGPEVAAAAGRPAADGPRPQHVAARPRAALVNFGPSRQPVRRVGVSARLGLRTYRAAAPVMLEGTVEVALGALVVGAMGATVDRNVTLGSLQAHLVGASLGVTAACRDGWLGVCVGARGVAGLVHVTGEGTTAEDMPATAVTPRTLPYLQGSAWLELGRDIGGVAAVIVVEAGYATGVIARGGLGTTNDVDGSTILSPDDEVAVAGVLGTATVGARW